MLSYVGTRGCVICSHQGTDGELIADSHDTNFGEVPMGAGFRLPFYIGSTFTRRKNVVTDLTVPGPQIMFVEKWSESKGHHVTTEQIPEVAF